MSKKDFPLSPSASGPDTDPIENPPSNDPRGGDDGIRGTLDPVDSQGHVTGQVKSRSGSVQVSFYIDGAAGRGILAGQVLADPVTKSFSWTIPSQFRDGRQHSLYAYGTSSSGETLPTPVLLTGSPRYFTL